LGRVAALNAVTVPTFQNGPGEQLTHKTMKKKKSIQWWDDLTVIQDPIPHIPEPEILKAMPEELHKEWEDFIRGQTCLLIQEYGEEKMVSGIYEWDFQRFVSKLKRGLPTADTFEEWD